MSLTAPNFQLFRPQQMYVVGQIHDNLGWSANQLQDPRLVIGKADVGDGKNHYLTLPISIYTDAKEPGKLAPSRIATNEPAFRPAPSQLGTLSYNA